MCLVVNRPAKVWVNVHLQVSGLVKVDRVKLKVIFVEGIVIVSIDFGISRFVVSFCYRCVVWCHLVTCVDFPNCIVLEVGNIIVVCMEGRSVSRWSLETASETWFLRPGR